jgi:glycosyltransferase involved in cell wall biosynthesis
MKNNNTSIVIVTSAWPSTDNGSGFAVMSLLDECIPVCDETQLIGVSETDPTDLGRIYPNLRWTHVRIQRLPIPLRFLLSLGSALPATCHQFKSKKTVNQVLNLIDDSLKRNPANVIILEDLPIAITFLDPIRKRFPEIQLAIRSENVLSEIFDPLTRQGNPLSRLAWTMEVSKMRQAESRVCRQADRVWAISANDRDEYRAHLGIPCDGVFGVSLNSDRFVAVAPGDYQTVVFVGGVDLRKRLGIVNFIKDAWPQIRAEVPNARFVLAGAGSEKLHDPANGILGLGRVADDREAWAQGQIALNPQELGSGIKLKSIVAMLSAKALVSTETGVQGIEAENGTHFLSAPDTRSLAPLVIRLMQDPQQARAMGQNAREWATVMYSKDQLRQAVSPLLKDFIENVQQ